jgi:hypothetical protein
VNQLEAFGLAAKAGVGPSGSQIPTLAQLRRMVGRGDRRAAHGGAGDRAVDGGDVAHAPARAAGRLAGGRLRDSQWLRHRLQETRPAGAVGSREAWRALATLPYGAEAPAALFTFLRPVRGIVVTDGTLESARPGSGRGASAESSHYRLGRTLRSHVGAWDSAVGEDEPDLQPRGDGSIVGVQGQKFGGTPAFLSYNDAGQVGNERFGAAGVRDVDRHHDGVREAVVPFDGMGAKLSDVVELVHAGLSRTKNTPKDRSKVRSAHQREMLLMR